MQILIPVWQRKRQWIYWIGHVLRHNIGLLSEIIEGKMRSKPRRGGEEFTCYKIWQTMHSNGQLRTESDGDKEEGSNQIKSLLIQEDTNKNALN